ncbi:hypothetical protein SAMN05444483_101348 [Salegentibacter echinorum]|uniref:Uncharacterized protein n=1 Tax=Salegentibacter echinorum TaxID=1073325 RepID=A0A1M5C5A2_SALEC|nr:hypothetical protein SAMN05444483_101348 [Salegentibacter echinorum]
MIPTYSSSRKHFAENTANLICTSHKAFEIGSIDRKRALFRGRGKDFIRIKIEY